MGGAVEVSSYSTGSVVRGRPVGVGGGRCVQSRSRSPGVSLRGETAGYRLIPRTTSAPSVLEVVVCQSAVSKTNPASAHHCMASRTSLLTSPA